MAQKIMTTIGSSEPLAGEDAERLVKYVENPEVPKRHDEFLRQADRTFESIKPRKLD